MVLFRDCFYYCVVNVCVVVGVVGVSLLLVFGIMFVLYTVDVVSFMCLLSYLV